jgi:hypothetical protein
MASIPFAYWYFRRHLKLKSKVCQVQQFAQFQYIRKDVPFTSVPKDQSAVLGILLASRVSLGVT